jgi:hypothetical protein
MRRLFLLCVLLLVAGTAAAQAGEQMFSIGLAQGTAYAYTPDAAGEWIHPVAVPELGVTGEYWYLFKEDYALAAQATIGFSSETRQPGDRVADPAVKQDEKFSTSSFKVRVGGDRVGKIGERFTWFMGPGLVYGSGKSTWKNIIDIVPPDNDMETKNVTVIGISGRFGGVMNLSKQLGIMGQIGHTLGSATVEDGGSKTTWYASSFNAAWGLHFTFGGK